MSSAVLPRPLATTREELVPALEFVRGQFAGWFGTPSRSTQEAEDLDQHYLQLIRDVESGRISDELRLPAATECWSCKTSLGGVKEYCLECGAPVSGPDPERLRHLRFTAFEIQRQLEANRLSLAMSHRCMADVNGQINALRRELGQRRALAAIPVDEPASPSRSHRTPERQAKAQPPRRHLLELLLDPRSSQWLLALGGVLLILGVVIYLATLGIFKNPSVIAGLLGAGNMLILAAGCFLVLRTRYQLAGRALALLASLAMPLNLWFYSAQGLITVQSGGLWVPALILCVLYAVSARILRDPTFVYALVAGSVLTALLMLADRDLQRFWQITVPASMLVGIGLVCIHVERVFAPSEGDFSRSNFGLAFFWAGHAVLLGGLLLLLGAQLAGGPLYQAYFKDIYEQLWRVSRPDVARFDTSGPWLALVLVLLGTYAYIYSDVVVRRVGWYLAAAVGTALWAELLLIQLLIPQVAGVELAIVSMSLTGLALNIALACFTSLPERVSRLTAPLAVLLGVVPVLLGIFLYLDGVTFVGPKLGWTYVGAMLVAAVSCRFGAYLRQGHAYDERIYLFGSAASLMLALVGLLKAVNPEMLWHQRAPIVALLPIAYLIAARLYRDRGPELSLRWVAHVGAAVMLLSSLYTALRGFVELRENPINLWLALFFAIMAVFYALETLFRPQGLRRGEGAGIVGLALMLAASAWQLLAYVNVATDVYLLVFGVLGVVLLACYRFAQLEKLSVTGFSNAAFWAGNALLLLASTGGALLLLERLTGDLGGDLIVARLPAVLTLLSLLALALVQQSAFRRTYVLSAVVQAGLTVLTLAVLSHLTYWQKIEVVAVVLGLALLLVGHIGLFRESQRQDDMVTFALLLGCLLTALPLSNATLYCRLYWTKLDHFHAINELGMLIVGLLLLASGFVLRIRMTTLTGGAMTLLWLLSIVLFLRVPERLQTTAVYLMLGGGAFFLTGLVLSVYRDRLLTMPERFKRREGLFRVLTWR